MAIEAHQENGEGAQLRTGEEPFQLLFDHSPDAVLLCDPHAPDVFWPIVACNSVAAHMNGYARDELIGQSIQLLHPDANAAAMRAVFLQALHAAETVHGEAAHQRKDGTVFPIEFSATLVNLNGRALVLSIDRDITERKRAEEALQRVNRDLSHRVAELSALHEIAQAVTQWTDLAEALETIGATMTWLFDRAAITIWIVDRPQDRIQRLAAITPDGTSLDPLMLDLADDLTAGAVIAGAQAKVLVPPTPLPRVAQPPAMPGQQHATSCLLLPLQSRGQVIGLLTITATVPDRIYTAADAAVALTIAGTLANAIENARLFEQAQVSAVEEERKRLARELHDSVSQALFLANLNAEVLPQLWEQDADMARRALGDLKQLTRSAQAEMRMLLLELRPKALINTPLHELLQTLGAAISAKHPLKVETHLVPAPRLPPDVQVALYRIAQEGFNNIVKHAQASCVSVALEVVPAEAGRRDHTWHGHIALHITDDGRGFAPTRVSAGRLGLGSMQERAAGVGAMFTISSEPGAGTSVSVRWSGRAADIQEGA